jgi:hypothetical protein
MNFIKENIINEKLDILKDKWNYQNLSSNKYLPINYVLNNPNLQWNFIRFSYNPNITLQNILDHKELPWDYHLSFNKNITFPAAKYNRLPRITLEF